MHSFSFFPITPFCLGSLKQHPLNPFSHNGLICGGGLYLTKQVHHLNIQLQQGGFSYNIDKKYYYEAFSNWLNKYYEKFIPYIFKKNKVIIEKTQYLRNIATLYDILQLKKYYNNISDNTISKVINNLNHYLEKFKNNKNNMRQSSAFLLLALHELDKKEYEKDISKITEFLYKELPKMERKFELGEVLMALTLTLDDNNNKEILLNKQKEMYIQYHR